MIQAVGDALSNMLGIIGDLIKAINGDFPAWTYNNTWMRTGIAIGICIAIIFVTLKLIKGTIWGR